MGTEFEPGIFCGTADGVRGPVSYMDTEGPIYPVSHFVRILKRLRRGQRIYGSFNRCDVHVFHRLKGGR